MATGVPGKRAREETTPATGEENARLRSVIDKTTEEFICPITYELPVDPVFAEDGKVYERKAIEDWLRKHANAKSPSTGLPMGKRLTPALQVKNVLEKMVRSGAIKGDKAEAWQKKIKEEEEGKEWLRKAEGGDAEAMAKVAKGYILGWYGFAQDKAKSFEWARRGAEAGNRHCMYRVGYYHLYGKGGAEKSVGAAMYWLTEGARDGSLPACVILGWAFAPDSTLPPRAQRDGPQEDGLDLQLPNDAKQATKWLRKALDRGKATFDMKPAIEAWLAAHAVE